MKKVIRGKLYDTETAQLIGGHVKGVRWSSSNQIDEKLYLKSTGEFFLAGKGGGQTKYAEAVENIKYNGEGIVPLTEEEAREWVELYLDADKYIELFGEPEE